MRHSDPATTAVDLAQQSFALLEYFLQIFFEAFRCASCCWPEILAVRAEPVSSTPMGLFFPCEFSDFGHKVIEKLADFRDTHL